MTAGEELLARWRDVWPQALDAWSSYTLLRDPRFFDTDQEAAKDGMAGEIAAIRLRDHAVMVNTAQLRARGLEGHALAILAHEVGHHVYVPGNMADHGRMIAVMSRVLVGLPRYTVSVAANLYADLLINDRLQRRAGVDIASVYVKLKASEGKGATSRAWTFYSRIYEHLWRLPPGTIAPRGVTEDLDADAMLASRIIRSFAGDWVRGARRFASVLFRHLLEDVQEQRSQTFVELGLCDTGNASAPAPGEPAEAAIPDGLSSVDPAELEDAGDILDDEGVEDPAAGEKDRRQRQGTPGTQHRQPWEYGELLKSLGLNLSEEDIAARYYRERALPHLIPFPARRAPQATEPLAEGYEEWGTGDSLESLDLLGSVLQSARVIPGVTTVQRVYGEAPGQDPAKVPMDLDIYVDCSGSMPDPTRSESYLALCATILALSALRAGARVQATLWSTEYLSTGGFIRDERTILRTVTGYRSGGTAFPVGILRDTYQQRKPSDPPAHIVVISDDGCDTMIVEYQFKGGLQRRPSEEGAAVAAMALARARGGGTLVLNIPRLEQWAAREPLEKLGFRLHAVQRWEDLVAFARAFVRENYGDGR